jgi:hypothetical protein
MKKCCFSLAFAVAIALPSALAEGPTAFDEFRQALGLSAGTLGNYGLSYAAWMPPFGASATGYLFYNQAAGSTLDYAITFELMYSLSASDFSNILSSQAYVFLSGNASSSLPIYGADENASVAVGVGAEAVLFRHLSYSFETGYFIAFPYANLGVPLVNFMAQTSFRYRF